MRQMLSFLFVAKIFACLFVVCAFCGTAYATTTSGVVYFDFGVDTSDGIKLLDTQQITDVKKPNSKSSASNDINLQSFFFSSLLAADDVIIAVFGANCSDTSDKTICIFTKYIDTTEPTWTVRAVQTNDAGEYWDKQLALQQTKDEKYVVKSLAAAANKNKIYILMVNQSVQAGDPQNAEDKRDLVLLEGVISKKDTKVEEITWKATKISDKLKDTQFECTSSENCQYFVPEIFFLDNKAVFVVQIEATQGNKAKYGIVQLTEPDNTLKLLYQGEVEKQCKPYFFSWEKKIVLVLRGCQPASNQQVQEFDLTAGKLEVSKADVGRMWRMLKDATSITKVYHKYVSAVLFTLNNRENGAGFWLTIANRLVPIGTAFTEDEKGFCASFVLTKGNLFSIYQKEEGQQCPRNGGTFYIKHFTEEATTLFNKLDEIYGTTRSVSTVTTKTNSIINFCFTDGRVGFLYGVKWDGVERSDKYFYCDSEVANGNKEQNGVKFSGAGAGAVWPVGKPRDDEPFNFADVGFTLVATVTIDTDTNDKDNSVLGLVLKEADKNVGLWCNKEKKWAVSVGKNAPSKESGGECVQGKTYIIALVLGKDENVKVYIDGSELTTQKNKEIKIQKNKDITHFYFGVDIKADNKETIKSHMTVKNVLLYNQPLSEDKVSTLKLQVAAVPPTSSTDEQTNLSIIGGGDRGSQTPGETAGVTGESADMSATPEAGKTQLASSGANAVRVSLLSFLSAVWAVLFSGLCVTAL